MTRVLRFEPTKGGATKALFKKRPKAPEPQPLAPSRCTLRQRSRSFDTDEGIQIIIEGYSPYLDGARTMALEENQHGLAAERIVYSRIVGGTHHKAELNSAAFDLGSQLGLVGLVHDAGNPNDANTMAVRAVVDKTIYTAGYLPRALAAVVAPLASIHRVSPLPADQHMLVMDEIAKVRFRGPVTGLGACEVSGA